MSTDNNRVYLVVNNKTVMEVFGDYQDARDYVTEKFPSHKESPPGWNEWVYSDKKYPTLFIQGWNIRRKKEG